MRVQVVEGVHELLSDLANLALWQIAVVLQDFEELSLSKLEEVRSVLSGVPR